MTVLDYCSGWLFRMPISDYFSRWLFRMTISGAYFSDFSRWPFRKTVPGKYFGCLFVIPRLILILATNSYFHGRFLFQPIIRLIGPTIYLFLNDGFLLQNYGPIPDNRAEVERKSNFCLFFADCQQKLLFTKHDTSGRFLLVNFSWETE